MGVVVAGRELCANLSLLSLSKVIFGTEGFNLVLDPVISLDATGRVALVTAADSLSEEISVTPSALPLKATGFTVLPVEIFDSFLYPPLRLTG